MQIGTKSILFGVHAFWIHPIVVALAWRRHYGHWPRHLSEWLAIFFHDFGYYGKANMDGAEGEEHPVDSYKLAFRVTGWLRIPIAARISTGIHILGHSRTFCKKYGHPASPLCAADKLSVLIEPKWFYLLRARASGEIYEFVGHAQKYGFNPFRHADHARWLDWYRSKVAASFKSNETKTSR